MHNDKLWLESASSTHDLLIRVLMSDIGLLGYRALSPNHVVRTIAESIQALYTLKADWKQPMKEIIYTRGIEIFKVNISSDADAALLVLLHNRIKQLAEQGAEKPDYYLKHCIFPTIDYMIEKSPQIGLLLQNMLNAEHEPAIRRFMAAQLNKSFDNKYSFR
ncbi:hypothetical protein ACI2KR_09240 [Pseudomonas luteola]